MRTHQEKGSFQNENVATLDRVEEYTFQSLTLLEEASAKIAVAITILDSQGLGGERDIAQLKQLQNKLYDYQEYLKGYC